MAEWATVRKVLDDHNPQLNNHKSIRILRNDDGSIVRAGNGPQYMIVCCCGVEYEPHRDNKYELDHLANVIADAIVANK